MSAQFSQVIVDTIILRKDIYHKHGMPNYSGFGSTGNV